MGWRSSRSQSRENPPLPRAWRPLQNRAGRPTGESSPGRLASTPFGTLPASPQTQCATCQSQIESQAGRAPRANTHSSKRGARRSLMSWMLMAWWCGFGFFPFHRNYTTCWLGGNTNNIHSNLVALTSRGGEKNTVCPRCKEDLRGALFFSPVRNGQGIYLLSLQRDLKSQSNKERLKIQF